MPSTLCMPITISPDTNYHTASKKIIPNILLCLPTHPVTKTDEFQLNTSDVDTNEVK